MAKETKTNFKTIGGSMYILIPYIIKSDDRFPLELDKDTTIRIEGNKIILENKKEE